jgi:hypothetical protein
MARAHHFQGSYKDNCFFFVPFFLLLQTYMLNITMLFTRPKASKLVMQYPHYIPLTCLQDLRFMSSSIGQLVK